MDKELTIHEKYRRDCEELWQRHVCGEIDAHEWATKDRRLSSAYVYSCLNAGDQGCNDLLAKMESKFRICA
jgi:hypothetical protein